LSKQIEVEDFTNKELKCGNLSRKQIVNEGSSGCEASPAITLKGNTLQ